MVDASNAVPGSAAHESGEPAAAKPADNAKDRIIEALMELAAEREWNDFSLSNVATRAGLSLADFRDAFPSKGAVLAGFSRKIDRIVLEGTTGDLDEESAKERLFDVLMRRLDAMAPYRLGLETVAHWVRSDATAAAALNQVALNSMRFMLEAAGIDTEGPTGAIKIQGLVLAWTRILNIWLEDNDPGLSRTMAALDKELKRGETLAARVDDLDRLASPLRLLGRALLDSRRRRRERRQQTEAHRRAEISDPSI